MLRFAVWVALLAAAIQARPSAAEPPAQQPASQPPAAASPAASGGFASELEKGSYAVGYNFGKTLQGRKIEVVVDLLLAGLRDALTGAQARMDEQESTVLARQVQNAAARRLQAERATLAAKNRAEGSAFLEANKKRTGVVALPSGLQYEVLRAGDGPKPAADDAVKVHFRGTLLDGTVFDLSEGEPIVLRPNSVIKGWAEALPIMTVGSKWKLFVPPDLGYGDNVAAGNIPPGATLVFEVELLAIEPRQGGN